MEARHCSFWPEDVPGTINVPNLKRQVDTLAGCLQMRRIIKFADILPESGAGRIQWRLLREREDSNNEWEQGR